MKILFIIMWLMCLAAAIRAVMSSNWDELIWVVSATIWVFNSQFFYNRYNKLQKEFRDYVNKVGK